MASIFDKQIKDTEDMLIDRDTHVHSLENMDNLHKYIDGSLKATLDSSCGDCYVCHFNQRFFYIMNDIADMIGTANRELNARSVVNMIESVAGLLGILAGGADDSTVRVILANRARKAFADGHDRGSAAVDDNPLQPPMQQASPYNPTFKYEY